MEMKEEEFVDAFKDVLASLSAAISIMRRSEDQGRRPSKVVGSDKMFEIMLEDYEKALEKVRKALR